jgi:hypothetical protein
MLHNSVLILRKRVTILGTRAGPAGSLLRRTFTSAPSRPPPPLIKNDASKPPPPVLTILPKVEPTHNDNHVVDNNLSRPSVTAQVTTGAEINLSDLEPQELPVERFSISPVVTSIS